MSRKAVIFPSYDKLKTVIKSSILPINVGSLFLVNCIWSRRLEHSHSVCFTLSLCTEPTWTFRDSSVKMNPKTKPERKHSHVSVGTAAITGQCVCSCATFWQKNNLEKIKQNEKLIWRTSKRKWRNDSSMAAVIPIPLVVVLVYGGGYDHSCTSNDGNNYGGKYGTDYHTFLPLFLSYLLLSQPSFFLPTYYYSPICSSLSYRYSSRYSPPTHLYPLPPSISPAIAHLPTTIPTAITHLATATLTSIFIQPLC